MNFVYIWFGCGLLAGILLGLLRLFAQQEDYTIGDLVLSICAIVVGCVSLFFTIIIWGVYLFNEYENTILIKAPEGK